MTDKYVFKSTRKAAGEELLKLADEGFDIVAVNADTGKSMFNNLLEDKYPERVINVGIAEQNMTMVAAGLAATGKISFASSYSVFTSMRCCEQIRTFICYPGLDVKIIAGIGGLSGGIEGVTHLATEDLGIMRCLVNMTVIAPSDYISTRKAVREAALKKGPVYIRVGRDDTPVLFDDTYDFRIGYPVCHRKGNDITLLATGLILKEVLEAAEMLKRENIEAEVIEVHTLKPVLDSKTITDSLIKTGMAITVEEHQVVGGLYTVVSELMAGYSGVRIEKSGLQDNFGESGTPTELREKYNLTAKDIFQKALKMTKE